MADELLSPTFRSSQLHTPQHLNRITIDDPHYRTYKRVPLDRMGRHWSYGGIGSPNAWDSFTFKPTHGAPVAKSHDHIGSGLFPKTRGFPVNQLYSLTSLKRSNLRWNDELVPRPLSVKVKENEVDQPFPAEHPLASHTPRFTVFPTSPPLSYNLAARRLRRSCSDCSDTGVIVANKTRGSAFRRERLVTQQFDIYTSNRDIQTDTPAMSCSTWDIPRSSRLHKRSRSYPGPTVLYDSVPATREGTSLNVLPHTTRGRELFENSLNQTLYQEEFTAKNTKPDILNLDKSEDDEEDDEEDGDDDNNVDGNWDKPASQRYYMPRPLEGRHSANAASLLPVRIQADQQLNTPRDANIGVDFRADTAATKTQTVSINDDAYASTYTYCAESDATSSRPRTENSEAHLIRPLSRHHQRQCEFSRTAVLNNFFHSYPETSPDLRDSVQNGKRHIIHGVNSYYFH